jgi:hypothetical protein
MMVRALLYYMMFPTTSRRDDDFGEESLPEFIPSD